MTDLIGKSLGRYHILEPLGQGGMASVFKAYDTLLERNVAIKIIRPDVGEANPGEFLKRFQREARALAQLDHPYILKVLDYGEQDGISYLVMPFVPGGTLKQKMGRPMPSQTAAALLAPVARALQYAHEQNIIHRDVKPANILVSLSGAPLLSDFGIAKLISGSGSTQLTAAGVGIGTPDYMAPEQWMGVANPGTDIYSLGVVFYEMITGRRPYTADTPAAVMLKHMRDPLPRPSSFIPGLPAAVEQVLLKALAREPQNRYKNMAAFASALEKLGRGADDLDQETVLSGEATLLDSPARPLETRQAALPTAAAPSGSRPGSLNMLLLGGAGLAALALLCVLALGALFASRTLFASKLPTAALSAGPVTGQLLSTPVPQGVTAGPAAQTTETSMPSTATQTETSTPRPPLVSIDGLPADVPLLKDNNGDLVSSTGQGMNTYTFSSNMTADQIGSFYLAAMQKTGWTLVNTVTQDTSKMWFFMKGDTRTVMISASEQRGKTMVSLMIPPVPTP